MENEGQTAVEWLIEKLTPSIALQQKYINELKEQAKEMEKEQKEIEHDKGWSKGWDEAVKEYEKNH